jgi:carbonic anhydrase
VPNTTSDESREKAAASLRQLLGGNRRFADGVPDPHVVTPAQREALLAGQHPKAVLLGCVDARVPPEVVLDQTVGDLLTVRTAGQSLAGVALGSIEFGVRVLGLSLVVVLGHTGCGAVLAALSDDHADGHLGELTGEVAVRLIEVVGADPVRATGANLDATVGALRAMPTLRTPAGHAPFVVGLLYDMGTGLVTVSDDGGLLAD